MAAQQIPAKLFTYSVIERKDEIEEVSAADAAATATVDARRRLSLSRRTRVHSRTYKRRAVCVYAYDPHVVVVLLGIRRVREPCASVVVVVVSVVVVVAVSVVVLLVSPRRRGLSFCFLP